MRQYQDLLRSEIDARRQAIRAESDELDRVYDAALRELEADGAVCDGQDFRGIHLGAEHSDRKLALAQEGAALEGEIFIRDLPEEKLEKCGGPGRD